MSAPSSERAGLLCPDFTIVAAREQTGASEGDMTQPAAPQLLDVQQYTLSEAAAILKYDERTIYRLIERGELAAIGRGRLRRIALSDIRAYQRRNRISGEGQ